MFCSVLWDRMYFESGEAGFCGGLGVFTDSLNVLDNVLDPSVIG